MEIIKDLTNIAEFKEYLFEKIDKISVHNIYNGFTFDNKPFSLSISAQINWSNLLLLPEGIFPITISCTDETTYLLTYANRINFYLTAVSAKNGALQAGTTLKQTVLAATTIEELEEILISL